MYTQSFDKMFRHWKVLVHQHVYEPRRKQNWQRFTRPTICGLISPVRGRGLSALLCAAALPRLETASSIRFVFVDASELLQEETDLGWGMIRTSHLNRRLTETRRSVEDKHISSIFTRQEWKPARQSKTASPPVCRLWRLALMRFQSRTRRLQRC